VILADYGKGFKNGQYLTIGKIISTAKHPTPAYRRALNLAWYRQAGTGQGFTSACRNAAPRRAVMDSRDFPCLPAGPGPSMVQGRQAVSTKMPFAGHSCPAYRVFEITAFIPAHGRGTLQHSRKHISGEYGL